MSMDIDLNRLASEATGLWFLELGPWNVFATLTFRRRRLPQRALDNMRWYLRELQRRLGRRIEAGIGVVEYHRNGNLHLHALLRVSNGITRQELRLLRNLWVECFG